MAIRRGTEVPFVVAARHVEDLADLRRAANCKTLQLWNLELADLSPLAQLPRLASLQVYGGRVGDWSALRKLRAVRELSLNNLSNQAAGIDFVAGLTQLETLNLVNMRQLTSLPDLSRLRQLARVKLWDCRRLADLSPLLAVPKLSELVLVDVPQSPDDLEPLIAKRSLATIRAQFGKVKLNARFAELLAKHGK